MTLDPSVIQKSVDQLAAKFRPERIILFGSQARGDADSNSDVDLLIITSISGSRRQMMIKMDRALRGFGLARDIVILTPEEFERDKDISGTIARPAWQEGKTLYARH